MSSFSAKTIIGLTCLATLALSAPSTSKPKPDPFSPSAWPLPRKITGDNDTANPGSKTQGWGGIHLHDPSVVLGPDGHYYSFSTHGLTVISRASKKGSLDGYWKILGSVLDAGSSVIDNAGSTDPWYNFS
jgi:arabinan endo-1,5-alpha-L-arabinosidase